MSDNKPKAAPPREFWIDEHAEMFDSLEKCEPEHAAFICVIEYEAYRTAKMSVNISEKEIARLNNEIENFKLEALDYKNEISMLRQNQKNLTEARDLAVNAMEAKL